MERYPVVLYPGRLCRRAGHGGGCGAGRGELYRALLAIGAGGEVV